MFCGVLWFGIQVKNPFNSRYDMQLITLQEADITVKFLFSLYLLCGISGILEFWNCCLHENINLNMTGWRVISHLV